MHPRKWSRRVRRRVVIVAATLAALGAVAVGAHSALATEVIWTAPSVASAETD